MKRKYMVYREDPKDAKRYEEFKRICSETEAIAFVESPKNLGLYGNLSLTYKGTDGITYEWNSVTHQWDWHDTEGQNVTKS